MITQNIDRIVTKNDFAQASKIAVTTIFRTLQGEGPYSGWPAVFLRFAGCNFGNKTDYCKFCFPPDHKIQTVNRGKLRFKDVKIGDQLPTLNRKGEVVATTVTNVLTREVPISDLVQLKFNVSGKTVSLVCTKDHPIKTSNRGYVQAVNLTAADRIVHCDLGEAGKLALSYRMTGDRNPMAQDAVRLKVASAIAKLHNQGVYKHPARTLEQRARYAVSKLGNKNPMKRHAVRLKNALAHKYQPSALAFKYSNLFEQLGIRAVHNTGTDKQAIGNDEVGYRIPDFVLSGKKVIEIYHTTAKYNRNGVLGNRTKRNYEIPTRNFYKALGYDVLFLTQLDLPGNSCGSGYRTGLSDTSKLKDKITDFKRNGATLISMQIGKGRGVSLHDRGDGYVDVVNFSCAPYNTFLVNDIQTHNCDTSFQLDQATWYTVDELVAEIGATYREGDVLVITGGEPTLQPLLPAFMLAASKALGIEIIQLESNGTQAYFYAGSPQLRQDLSEQGTLLSLIVSPKANETVGRYGKLSNIVIENASYLKFVLSADPASAHHTVPDWAPKHKLYVSPMAEYKKAYKGEVSSMWDHDLIDAVATQRNYGYAAQYAIEHSVKLSVQTHLFTAIP